MTFQVLKRISREWFLGNICSTHSILGGLINEDLYKLFSWNLCRKGLSIHFLFVSMQSWTLKFFQAVLKTLILRWNLFVFQKFIYHELFYVETVFESYCGDFWISYFIFFITKNSLSPSKHFNRFLSLPTFCVAILIL